VRTLISAMYGSASASEQQWRIMGMKAASASEGRKGGRLDGG
jgi:hypothetical protein